MSKSPSARGLADLARVIRTTGTRLVHTHGGVAGFYGRLAARWVRDIRTVHTYHGIHYLHDRRLRVRYLHRAIDRFLLGWTDEIICVAKSDKDLALRERLASPGHVSVIYNGIDFAQFEMSDARDGSTGSRNEHVIVGTVGRLHEQKGHIYLLQAATLIHRAYPQVRFRIIGDGPLRKSLEAQSRALGVDGIVEFLGARNDVPVQLHQFDLFVLPSLWEGLPYVLLEAMAAGLPVVTTDVDAVRELIADGWEGTVVPSSNAQALAAAVIDHIGTGALRVDRSVKGAQVIKERFSLDAMVEQTLAVYSRAMNA
jgi:glycosyltransferase involved in cell wall biosynthesis